MSETLSLLDEVAFDGVFAFKYSPRPNTPALKYDRQHPRRREVAAIEVLMERQREIQMRKLHSDTSAQIVEVMVEGENEARGQWIGRTSQNKTLNFTAPANARSADRQIRAGAGNGKFPE